MEFSVLDKQTLQCVMTEEEIADYGMDKRSIYQNDARAVDFFRQIMQRAQQETGFVRQGESIAVHAAFLSDESLEITFSSGLGGSDQTDQSLSALSQSESESEIEEQERKKELERKNEEAAQIARQMETAILKSRHLIHVTEFCGKAPAGLKASFYEHRGVYFLLADVREYGVRDTARLFQLADEYMESICYTKSIAAYIREHGRCMIRENAVEILGKISRNG
ncbi:MAG: adaptor protein MecA [Eubacterium sp.]|nr:adaptor protein MecA [Eubacterium sp.]